MPSAHTPGDNTPNVLNSLTRKRDRGGDRTLLNATLDAAWVGTLTTVIDGWPWSVPLVYARIDDDILLHGSTGAGALRQAAAGAPVALTVFTLDGLVISDTLMDHSANYRSAVVRGHLAPCADTVDALRALTDRVIPGRSAELPPPTARDLAATTILRLPISGDNWIAKQRSGGPGVDTDEWTGVLDMHTAYGGLRTYTGATPPPSIRKLLAGDMGDPQATRR